MKQIDFGCAAWSEVAALQAEAVLQVQQGGEEVVFFGEHPPTVSLGRRSKPISAPEETLLRARGFALFNANRGGATTIFSPGQAIVYPIVRLQGGVVAHVERLAEAGRKVAAGVGVASRFLRQQPGLWTATGKLASIGIRVERRVSSHGLALNVSNELTSFGLVEICATPGLRMTSLVNELSRTQNESSVAKPWMARWVAQRIAEALCESEVVA